MKARSRRELKVIRQKMKRLKVSTFFLATLFLIYIGQKILLNSYIFHPVQILANTDRDVVVVDHEVEVVREVEVDRDFKTEKQQILAYIVEKFGDRAADAITLVNKCENHSFNPKAVNHNRNGTVDRGIFQINSIHGGEEMFDWKKNIDMAYKIYHSHGDKFTAWTCAGTVGEKNYLGK